MTGSRVRLTIDRLRVHGASRADAAALAEGLQAALAEGLTADAGAFQSGALERVSLTLPAQAGRGPAATGRAAGHRIAGALGRAGGDG